MEKFAREREQTPDRAERTDTLVWGKNAVTELLKSGGAVDTVYLTDAMPQAVAGYYTALSKESGAVVSKVQGVRPSERVEIRFADGAAAAEILTVSGGK